MSIPSCEPTDKKRHTSTSSMDTLNSPNTPRMEVSNSFGSSLVPSPSTDGTLTPTCSPYPVSCQLEPNRPPTDLFEAIEKVGYFTEAQAKHMFRQICASVDYLHNVCGVVHRDIKDENIVVDSNLNVKIIDFGNSAFIPCRSVSQDLAGQTTTRSGTPLPPHNTEKYFSRFYGTMHYAAPEILRGLAYRGPEADCWSLGILLYTILCGELPFADADQTVRLRFAPMKWPRSQECVDLVTRMLEKDPSKRITVEQVLQHPWMQ